MTVRDPSRATSVSLQGGVTRRTVGAVALDSSALLTFSPVQAKGVGGYSYPFTLPEGIVEIPFEGGTTIIDGYENVTLVSADTHSEVTIRNCNNIALDGWNVQGLIQSERTSLATSVTVINCTAAGVWANSPLISSGIAAPSNWIIKNNTLNGGGFCIGINADDPTTYQEIRNTQVLDNYLGFPGTDAIRASGYNGLVIRGNEIEGVIEDGSHNDGFQSVWGGKNLVFADNYLHDNNCQPFFIKDGWVEGVLVEDNLFVRNRVASEPVVSQIWRSKDVVVRYNTWWDDSAFIIRDDNVSSMFPDAPWENLEVHHNILQSFQMPDNIGGPVWMDEHDNIFGTTNYTYGTGNFGPGSDLISAYSPYLTGSQSQPVIPGYGSRTRDAVAQATPKAKLAAAKGTSGKLRFTGDLYIPGFRGNPNVGTLTPKEQLPVWPGGSIDGLTIEGYRIPNGSNVLYSSTTLRNCWIYGGTSSGTEPSYNILARGTCHLVMEDCHVGEDGYYPDRHIYFTDSGYATIRRTRFQGGEDMLKFKSGCLYEMIQADLLEPPPGDPAPHGDNIQTESVNTGTSVEGYASILRYCNLPGLWYNPRPNIEPTNTSAVIIKADFGYVSNVLIDNNYLGGGNYSLHLRNGQSYRGQFDCESCHVTNNIFGLDHRYGFYSIDDVGWDGLGPGAVATWENNVDTNGNPVTY